MSMMNTYIMKRKIVKQCALGLQAGHEHHQKNHKSYTHTFSPSITRKLFNMTKSGFPLVEEHLVAPVQISLVLVFVAKSFQSLFFGGC